MDLYRRTHRLGASQHGVWTRAQARGIGWTDERIDTLIANGAWVRWFDGPVYSAAGTPVTYLTRLTAGALRVGADDAVVAGRAAARLWLLPGFDALEPLEFVVLREHTPAIAGLRVARTIHLPDEDVVTHSGLRVTSVTRTLHDLAAVVSDDELLVAAADAWSRGRTEPLRLLGAAAARPRMAGNRRLRRVLEALDPRFQRTRSVAEIVDLAVLNELGGLPPFQVNVRRRLSAGTTREADVLFEPNAVLEVQSRRFHGSVVQRRADAVRRAEWEADGFAVRELWPHELHDRRRVRAVLDDLFDAAAERRSGDRGHPHDRGHVGRR